ncbi:glycerol-3-phosphate dehydrogenase [Stenotrophomonas sp. C3(2023)]|uniref:glycerol-3-phosphate dehydrogenase n=1 Tax=Stenotrophomonas sp. C3(2023) TaxID=3080277 RepID=UPI00293C6F43|nr:glycerol-3-phosphate dehydrogenase [Stenotrophomonas sp. C3(2023)]MDV3469839.1 glycerol-3-phosphate dehydrogenase [Stenotrophomonas sp. C3(2023)]
MQCRPAEYWIVLDVLVVGGGINGAGIARDAAGRGLRVALCEQHDLAQHTSSASSKLIHGGLRYLQQGHLSLVRQALVERAILLRTAPHLVTPLPFLIPHEPTLRPAWMLRAGLWLYDQLGSGRTALPRHRCLRLDQHAVGEGLRDRNRIGFTYCDAKVHDARLVLANIIDAHALGAQVWTRTRCVFADRRQRHWDVTLEDSIGRWHRVQTRTMVNATGPWAAAFADDLDLAAAPPLRLVQGSHIVVPALFPHDHALLLQQPDGRVVFAIPYEDRFTLVGTTDVDYTGDPAQAIIDDAQRQYLCAAVNRSVVHPVSATDIFHSFSGVRPLLASSADRPSAAGRGYRLQLDLESAPLLTIAGGKLTTYRLLAERAVDLLLGNEAGRRPGWTRDGRPLPGGERGPPPAVAAWLQDTWPWLPAPLVQRWARSQGSRAAHIIGDARSLEALGEHFGGHLYAAEVRYLRDHEWALHADDVLWRRTQLGLLLDDAQQARLTAWLQQHPPTALPTPGDGDD